MLVRTKWQGKWSSGQRLSLDQLGRRNDMTIAEEFEGLRASLLRAGGTTGGDCRALEPSLVAILQLVQERPEARLFFVEKFVEIAVGRLEAPTELVPFCMRELRFPEVRQAVAKHFDELHAIQRHARYMNFCSDVMKAYDDFVWEDADLWDYFRRKELVPSVVPALVEHLRSDEVATQWNALLALESLGQLASNALPAVEEFLQRQAPSSSLVGRTKLVIAALS